MSGTQENSGNTVSWLRFITFCSNFWNFDVNGNDIDQYYSLDRLVCTWLRKGVLLRLPVLAPPKTFKYALEPWFNIVYLISDYKAKMLYEIFPFTLKYLDLLSEYVRLCVQDPVNAYIKIMGFLRWACRPIVERQMTRIQSCSAHQLVNTYELLTWGQFSNHTDQHGFILSKIW